LEREKQSHPDDQGVQDIADFFVQVFAKAYYLKTQLRYEVADCLNYLRDKFQLDNKEFLALVKSSPPATVGLKGSSINLKGVLPPETIRKLHNPKLPPPNFVLPLPPQVMQKMAAVAVKSSGNQPAVAASLPAKTEPYGLVLPASGRIIKGEAGEVASVPSVQMLTPVPNYGSRMMVKTDPDAPPGSVMPASVYPYMASVHVLDSVPPGTAQPGQVGRGSTCLQFFYENPQDGEKIAFKPVYVDTEEDVQCVVALVAERAAEYQSKVGLRPKQYQYFSDAVRAKSQLDPDVVRYIERCFTKGGMKDHKKGLKKRYYPKRKQTLIVQKSVKKEPSLDDDEEEEDEEEESIGARSGRAPVVEPIRVEILEPPSPPLEDEDDPLMEDEDDADYVGYVSDEDMSKRNLERLVFGSVMPKVKLKEKDLAKPPSERAGRGGHNVRDETNPENVLNAVDFMLNPEAEGVDNNFSKQIKQTSQFKTRRKTR
jgi:hypothetical protein